MSKLSKIPMIDILELVTSVLGNNDIIYYCDYEDIIEEFYTLNNEGEKRRFFIKYEDKIDKEKLLLLSIKNAKDTIKDIDDILNTVTSVYMSDHKQREGLRLQLQNQKTKLEKNLAKIKKISKDINKVIALYVYDEDKNRYEIEAIDSKNIIRGKSIDGSEKLKRFNEIDSNRTINKLVNNFNENEAYGIECITQFMLLTDLFQVFPDEQFGDTVRTMIIENNFLDTKIMTKNELSELKKTDPEKYFEIMDNTKIDTLTHKMKNALIEYIAYVDIDKLLMISAYRLKSALEEKMIDPKYILDFKEILNEILKSLSKDKITLNCTLQNPKDNLYKLEDVRFSVKDIKQCISHFTSNSYLTQQGIEEYKEKLEKAKLNLFDINPEVIDMIFSYDELEKLANLNDNNFSYVSEKLQWDKDKILKKINKKGNCSSILLKDLLNNKIASDRDILELYMSDIIGLEQIRSIKSDIDLSEEISSDKLNQYYNYSISQKSQNQNASDDFNKYLDLYKEVLIKDSPQKLELYSNRLMEQIVEEYKEENRDYYIEKVEKYYKEGILTLNSLVEWDNERIITKLYEDKLITLEDIKQLAKEQKVSFDYISKKYSEIVSNKDIDYDKRLGYLQTGYVREEEIFKLYNANLIFEDDLNELMKKGIVREEQLKQVINNRTRESLEKKSSIKLGNLNMLTKRNHNIYLDNNTDMEYYIDTNKKPKIIIDPNERAEFINLFRASKAEAYLDEDNPFYNYEFYVIPDESGEIGLNSVVIAERYYENKESEERFATNNATYFFKYKDLMVLSNLKKSEMTKERKNIVFTANHSLATEEKGGRWASNVICAIAKTMMSSDLKEYSKENQKRIVLEKLNQVYSYNEMMKILDKATEIDLGEYLYEIEDTNNAGKRIKKFDEKNDAGTR